jgi:hypothetical protein
MNEKLFNDFDGEFFDSLNKLDKENCNVIL